MRMKPKLDLNVVSLPCQEPLIEQTLIKNVFTRKVDPAKHKPWKIGCTKMLEFDWGFYEVAVYKRARWVTKDKMKWKYKDWKIRVTLKEMRSSKDKIVLYKLPVPLPKIQAYLNERLQVKRTAYLNPQPIEYISLRIGSEKENPKIVYS